MDGNNKRITVITIGSFDGGGIIWLDTPAVVVPATPAEIRESKFFILKMKFLLF